MTHILKERFRTLSIKQDRQGMLDLCRMWTRNEPLNAEAWMHLGFVTSNFFDRNKDALNAYRMAVHIDPENPYAWKNFGDVYDKLNLYEKAINAYRRAVRINPKYIAALDNLAATYHASGNRTAALTVVDELGRLDSATANDRLWQFEREEDALLVPSAKNMTDEPASSFRDQGYDPEAMQHEQTKASRPALRKKKVAGGPRLTPLSAKEIERECRFIDNNNGTVSDTRTGLMWAAKDNGGNINWANAKSYCEHYCGGDYTDWRMPTQDELAGLHDASKSQQAECRSSYQNHVATDLIHLTCFYPWASETCGSEAAFFNFYSGLCCWIHQSTGIFRALPVRSGK